MFYVYILKGDESDELYIGFTHNLRKRLREHNTGRSRATRQDRWRCIYYEACISETDARRRERYLKTIQGKRLLKRRLKDYLYSTRRAN